MDEKKIFLKLLDSAGVPEENMGIGSIFMCKFDSQYSSPIVVGRVEGLYLGRDKSHIIVISPAITSHSVGCYVSLGFYTKGPDISYGWNIFKTKDNDQDLDPFISVSMSFL